MSWGPLLVNLAVTAGLVAVLMLATFAYAMRTRVHAIMDTIWPLGFVLIALVSFLLSAGSGVAVASPAYMTNMLVRHTGKRLLEKHMARSKGAAYAEYVRRTSGFIPWPPR
jgi:steroid 5-alpha reductase family enzyme